MKATTSLFGSLEKPFNLPYLVASSGATFVARWTTLDVRRMVDSFQVALTRKGFSFVEVLSPCPELYMRRNKLGDGLTMMRQFQENRVIQHGADPKNADVGATGEIIVGRFVDIDRPTYHDAYTKMCIKIQEGKKPSQQGKESSPRPKKEKSPKLKREKRERLQVAVAPTGDD
jgi:2-oxoglutarate ferredoxin oxidoreductase subunit beta